MAIDQKLRLAHALFVEKARSSGRLSIEEVVQHAGWKRSTVKTYMTKQWEQFIVRQDDGSYQVVPEFQQYPLDVFLRINSQKYLINKDPFKPLLSRRTEELVTKAREAALLAVQVYNNPLLAFRTPSFIVHMVIAFTSLFHAVFEQQGIEYWYKSRHGTPTLVEDRPKLWDVSECIRRFWGDEVNGVRKNLELFVALRDQVEHRYAPALDAAIAAECQALLLNFERVLVEEFSPYYSLGAQISVPLQLSRMSNQARIDVLRELQKADYQVLKEFVDAYRNSLSDEVFGSPEYAFRVFLVPKPATRESAADMQMEFIRADEILPDELEQLQRQITLIKTRMVPVANQGLFKPKDVVALVQEVEPRFRIHEHTLAWKYFKVRPRERQPEGCDVRYCQYDVAHNDFVYTQAWIERLKKAVRDGKTYRAILDYRDS